MRLIFTWNTTDGGILTVNARHITGMRHVPNDGVWPERTVIAAEGFPGPIIVEENAEQFKANAQMWREVVTSA